MTMTPAMMTDTRNVALWYVAANRLSARDAAASLVAGTIADTGNCWQIDRRDVKYSQQLMDHEYSKLFDFVQQLPQRQPALAGDERSRLIGDAVRHMLLELPCVYAPRPTPLLMRTYQLNSAGKEADWKKRMDYAAQIVAGQTHMPRPRYMPPGARIAPEPV